MTHASEDTSAAPAVIEADPKDAERVFGALTLAFAADPPNRWMYPDPAQYLRYFPAFARALGGAALPRRTAFVNRDCTAVALWLAPDAGPDDEALTSLVAHSVAPDKRGIMAEVFDQMVRCHPQEPHWYLPFIGVDPARQGQGLGAALLRPVLTQCDSARLPAYLELTNPRNRPLYERHGFQAVGEIRAGSCPPIVPMLRRPKPMEPGRQP